MEKGYYLSEGDILGGHYKIVKVLGEDAFEILYLVEDTHRLESVFVIKEFFLKAYAQRENKEVTVVAKSKFLFEETKKDMLNEIRIAQKNNHNSNQAKTYGYFEENNTVYTIMEFINDSNMKHYLEVEEDKKDEIILPAIEEPNMKIEKEKEKKSYLFVKVLLFLVFLMLGMGYYSWNMIKEDKERAKEKKLNIVTERTINAPPLQDREKKEEKPVKQEEVKSMENLNQWFDDDSSTLENEEIDVEEEVKVEVKEELQIRTSNISLDTLISGADRSPRFNRVTVKRFLDKFMLSSTDASIDEIVAQYDGEVERYFSLKNVNHNTIRKDKVRYQRKWTQRNFRLLSFKIISLYREGNFDYCDLSTFIEWNVATDNLQRAEGTSKGRMTLKRTADGFKVTSIYTVK